MIHVFFRRPHRSVRYITDRSSRGNRQINIDTGLGPSVYGNKWVNFKIVQYRAEDEGGYVYKIFVNGEEIYATKLSRVDMHRNLKAYLGHPNKSFQQYKGRISDLQIDGERYERYGTI